MAITASVGELVRIQFPCFDIDGVTPMSGLVNTDFVKLLLRDNVVSAVVATVSEVGSTGRYVISFTPDADGLWYAEVQTPVDDIFSDQVEVGPPPDDWLTAIADVVWWEGLPGAFPVNSAGWRLANVDENVTDLHHALIMAVLTATGGDVSHVETNATKPDSFYDNLTVVVRDSAGNVARRIATYEQTNGSFVFGGEDLPFVPTAGDQVIVLGILGRVLCENSEEMLIRLIEIHRLLGLDAEYPLCITKTSQEVDAIKLTHTEVGNKLIVRRE